MNLVFDLGGVVLRWAPQQFLPRLLPARAGTPAAADRLAADFFQSFGGDWAEFDRGSVEVDELAERIARRTGLLRAEVDTVIAAVPHELTPLPDTVDLLERLRGAGHRLFYLSNMPAPYATFLCATQPLFGCFENGLFSSQVRLIKPEPAIFAVAASHFGIAPRDLLFTDDVQKNVDAACACGWQAWRFKNAPQFAALLVEMGVAC